MDATGKTEQRSWLPSDQPENESSGAASSTDSTFRQPLPPGIRPRMSVSTLGRPGLAQAAMRLAQIDPRMQGLDPKTRLIIQQHQVCSVRFLENSQDILNITDRFQIFSRLVI